MCCLATPSFGVNNNNSQRDKMLFEFAQPNNKAQKNGQAKSALNYPQSQFKAKVQALAETSNVTIKATLWDEDNDDENSKIKAGLYSFQSNSPVLNNLFYDFEHLSMGSFYNDEKIYSPVMTGPLSDLYSEMYIIDSYTGQLLSTKTINSPLIINTSTYCPAMAAAIGCAAKLWSIDYKLVTLNKDGELTVIKDLTDEHRFTGGMATAPDGTIYALTDDGRLYTINTSDFSFSLVGETGISNSYESQMVYDKRNNLLYAMEYKSGANTSFYAIDPQTAEAEKMIDFGRRYFFGVMYIENNVQPEAPGMVSDLKIDFAQGAYTGTVSFVPPTTTHDGKTATGSISYTILDNGKEAASGTTTYGASKVTNNITITKDGYHDITVFCSNAVGESEWASQIAYLGHDAPSAVSDLVLTANGSTMNLAWGEPKPIHDGYMIANDIEYEITRIVNGVETTVKTGHKGTSYTDTYNKTADVDLEAVRYKVKAKYRSFTSPDAISNKIVLGSVVPPFAETFETEAMFDYFTVIDANEDGYSWAIDTQMKTAYCQNNLNKTPDDYLVLPPVSMKKNKIYTISFTAGCQMTQYPEQLAFYVGTKPETDALNEELIKLTEITVQYDYLTKAGQHFEVEYVPTEDNVYYFAILSYTQKYNYLLNVTDIKISAPLSSEAPSAVEELTVTPDNTGKAEVTISFKAPTVSINETPLTTLSKIEIYRGEDLIKTINNPTPGALITEKDTNPTSGEVKYSVAAYNAEGRGITRGVTVYVGLAEPEKPANFLFSNGADYGEAKLTWNAVTKDINGKDLTDVTYWLYRLNGGEWDLITDDITEPTYTIRECGADDAQKFVQYRVEAYNGVGTSEFTVTPLSCVGKPDSTPYLESATIQHIIGFLREKGEGRWALASDGDNGLESLKSYNGDNKFFKFSVQYPGEMASIITGRIHADLRVPVLTFYYYGFGGMDYNFIEVSVNDGKEVKKVGEPIHFYDGIAYQWNRATIYLPEYAGKDIQIILTATGENFGVSYIDHIMLDEAKGQDLGVSISAPESVASGTTLPIDVMVFNYGLEDQDDYTIDLIVNDEIYETKDGEPLAGGKSAVYEFDYPVSIVDDANIKIKAFVNSTKDDDVENNMSETLDVKVRHPYYPTVKDLKGSVNKSNLQIELTWSQPKYSDFTLQSTEDFESFDSFATEYTTQTQNANIGDWKFVDGDRSLVGRFTEGNIPNVQYMTPQAFFVLDCTHELFNSTFASHSGNKYLAALFNYDESPNDDWAISPELNGYAQKITFFARAYASSYPEKLKVLYSTTDNKTKSFTEVETFTGITTNSQFEWTKYEFEVPEGAKYFAINYINAGGFMVFVDDVTFSPKNGTPIEFAGYNVYRDGRKINNEILTTNKFTDPEGKDDQVYNVTVVYNVGESGPSNSIKPNGDPVSVDNTTDNHVEVYGAKGEIIIAGAENVLVSDVQSRILYIGTSATVPVQPGIYIVRADGNTYKVVVR